MNRSDASGGGVLVPDSLPIHSSSVLRGDGAGTCPKTLSHGVRIALISTIPKENEGFA